MFKSPEFPCGAQSGCEIQSGCRTKYLLQPSLLVIPSLMGPSPFQGSTLTPKTLCEAQTHQPKSWDPSLLVYPKCFVGPKILIGLKPFSGLCWPQAETPNPLRDPSQWGPSSVLGSKLCPWISKRYLNSLWSSTLFPGQSLLMSFRTLQDTQPLACPKALPGLRSVESKPHMELKFSSGLGSSTGMWVPVWSWVLKSLWDLNNLRHPSPSWGPIVAVPPKPL